MEKGNFEIQKSHIEPEKLPEEGEKKIEDKLAEAIGKMYEQLQETGKNLREVIPQDRNFDIELQESEDGINLRLRHKESGKEKDLNLFLPPEHFFGKDETFVYKGREKKIGFPENELEFRGFLLSLFHEIGHSHEKQEHSITIWETLKALWEGVSKWAKSIRIKKELHENEKESKIVYRVTSLPAEALLPKWYLDQRSHSEAKSERDAWAYALRSLRKLKQEGYDVFAGFDNVDQISAYVAYCLYTYDMDLFMKRLMSGDLKDLQKLRESPAFWKKSKMYNRVILPGEDDKERESAEDKS
jgi:hypothetical protein